MTVRVPLGGGLALEIGEEPVREANPGCGTPESGVDFPTARLRKGLLLLDGGEDLAEEGVGFGVPVLKRGVRTVFAGHVDVVCGREGSEWEVTATYDMDLVERLAKGEGGGRAGGEGGAGNGGSVVRSRTLYAAKDALAALHRRAPGLRRPLAGISAAVRRAFGLVTTYEQTASCGTIRVTHVVRPGSGAEGDGVAGGGTNGGASCAAAETRVAVAVDLTGLTGAGITEVVVMNEQGARYFDRYEDESAAVLHGADIGTWDEVGAARASLVSTARRVSFAVAQVPGARLYRGRELVGTRLAWAGFGYSFPPARDCFRYELTIVRTV